MYWGDNMLFIDLLKKADKEKVFDYLSRSEEKYIKEYRKLYSELLNKKVKENIDLRLFVVLLKDYFEDEEYVSVYGYSKKDNTCYALDFMEWSEWLGCEVIEKSLSVFGEDIFIGECLKEMTFISFEESKVEEEKEELNRRVEEIESGEAELLSSEEFFAKLSEELGEGFEIEEQSEEDREKELKKIEEVRQYNEKMINLFIKD